MHNAINSLLRAEYVAIVRRGPDAPRITSIRHNGWLYSEPGEPSPGRHYAVEFEDSSWEFVASDDDDFQAAPITHDDVCRRVVTILEAYQAGPIDTGTIGQLIEDHIAGRSSAHDRDKRGGFDLRWVS